MPLSGSSLKFALVLVLPLFLSSSNIFIGDIPLPLLAQQRFESLLRTGGCKPVLLQPRGQAGTLPLSIGGALAFVLRENKFPSQEYIIFSQRLSDGSL